MQRPVQGARLTGAQLERAEGQPPIPGEMRVQADQPVVGVHLRPELHTRSRRPPHVGTHAGHVQSLAVFRRAQYQRLPLGGILCPEPDLAEMARHNQLP
jgi:hypothetical protein